MADAVITMTSHDPEIPTNFTEDDWLDFAGSRGVTIKFHKNTGYFYYWESESSEEKIRLRCACKQFMIKHHDSKCVHYETEYEMSEKCWVSDWFLLGSPDKWHNHPPPSRMSVELKLFEWQVNLTFVKNRNAVAVNHVVEEMYESWPFSLLLSESQLKKLFRTEPEEGSTFLDQDKVDSMMVVLMSWSEYWGNPQEFDNLNLKSEKCCDGITENRNKRSLPSRESSTSRLQKKMKLPVLAQDDDDDYDTEPLPEESTYRERNIEPEPIACGSRDRTPSPKKSKSRNMVAPSFNDKSEDLFILPDKVVPIAPLIVPKLEPGLTKAIPLKNGKPWGPFSTRHPVGELKLTIDKTEEVCEPIGKVSRFAENLLKRSQKIGNRNDVDIFAVPLSKSIGLRSTVERFEFGKAICPKKHMTVLVLGATSLGPTKLINGIINHIFGVVKEDCFRFELVEEKKNDQPSHISVYDIHHVEGFRISFSLTIVHTPSYNADVTTLFSNQKLIQTFREFFEDEDGINELDMVCNVAMKDEMNKSFLSIFGYDVEENINRFWLRNTEECPLDELIQRFFSVLTSTKTKSLEGTKEVLQVMKRLEETVDAFPALMKSLLVKEEEMQKARLVFTTCQSQIEVNKETDSKFSLETVEQVYRKEVLWKSIEREGRELFTLLAKEFGGAATTILELLEIAWVSIRQLKRISRGNPYLTEELYDLLFGVEEKLKHHGFQEKIESLKKLCN